MKEESESEGGDGALPAAVEEAKRRCKAVGDRTEKLRLNGSCKSTLLRLVHSELSFLSRFPLSSSSNTTLHPYLPLRYTVSLSLVLTNIYMIF